MNSSLINTPLFFTSIHNNANKLCVYIFNNRQLSVIDYSNPNHDITAKLLKKDNIFYNILYKHPYYDNKNITLYKLYINYNKFCISKKHKYIFVLYNNKSNNSNTDSYMIDIYEVFSKNDLILSETYSLLRSI